MKRLLLLIALLLYSSPVWAALAVDTYGQAGYFTESSHNESATTSGSDRALVVIVSIDDASNSVTSITYNGVSLSQIGRQTASGSGSAGVEMWALSNPASGSHTLTVNFGGTPTGLIAWISFTGAHQTTASLTGTVAASTNKTVTVSSATDEIVVDAISWGDSTGPTVGSGQTLWANGQPETFHWGASSYESGATSVTMDYTNDPGFATAHLGVSIKPVSGGSPPATPDRRTRRLS